MFDGHFVHDQVSDLKRLSFYLSIYIQVEVWVCDVLVLKH